MIQAYTLTIPSFSAWCNSQSIASSVPVRPTPALGGRDRTHVHRHILDEHQLFILWYRRSLTRGESLGGIRYHPFDRSATPTPRPLTLGLATAPITSIAGIHGKNEGYIPRWINQYMQQYKRLYPILKHQEGLLAAIVPDKFGMFFSQTCKEGHHTHSVRDITPLIRCQCQSGKVILDSMKYVPVLHSGSLHGVNSKPTTHNADRCGLFLDRHKVTQGAGRVYVLRQKCIGK